MPLAIGMFICDSSNNNGLYFEFSGEKSLA